MRHILRTALTLAWIFGAVSVWAAEPTRVILDVSPSTTIADPGPQTLIGGATAAAATQFASADFSIGEGGDCRVYFDLNPTGNFHFMDRRGRQATLGLHEAGADITLAQGILNAGPVRIARHGAHLTLYQGGTLALSAFDDRLSGGAAGLRMLDASSPVSLKAEAREELHFSDDFMVNEEHSAQWRGNGSKERGGFAVHSLKNPVLSANGFCYLGKGRGVYSVVGQQWWDRYVYSAALRGPAGARIGLVFAFQDDANYGLFRWSANAAGVRGKRELLRVRGGKEEMLAESEGGYAPDQWYGASIRVAYDRTVVSVDGHPLLEASDPNLCCGGAGVWCDVPLPATLASDPNAQPYEKNSLYGLMRQHAVFDDVKIDAIEGVEDHFNAPGPLRGGWLAGSGDWKVAAAAPVDRDAAPLLLSSTGEVRGGCLVVTPFTSQPARALLGDRRWAQYKVEADVTPGAAAAGIILLHRDESSYYSATIDGGQLKLTRHASAFGVSQQTLADSAKLPAGASAFHISASVVRGHIQVSASAHNLPNAAPVSVETFDTGLLRGRAGLIAAPGAAARFQHFSVAFIHETEPLVTTNAVFEDEILMNVWSNTAAEWHPSSAPYLVDGKPVSLLWHRSQFPGDVEMTVEPRDVPESGFELGLSLAKSGQGKDNGYILRYRSRDGGENASRTIAIEIDRGGEKVGELIAPDDHRPLLSLGFRRCGRYVVAIVNGRPVLSYRDEHPLDGGQIAYYTRGVTLRSEATKIATTHCRDEMFSTAPVAWRTAGEATIAEVTNRWQCDPRWSFMSIMSEVGRKAAAVLWSKARYAGDVSVEFFAGNKMETGRGKAHYTYARDINVTLCSDGADLTRGYTFHFGGNNNSGSYITRNGLEVKRSAKPVLIPTDMNFHQKWFSIRAEKSGSHISFRITADNRQLFEDEKNEKGEVVGELAFDDPNPLSGPGADRVAVWTYDHGIMLSRVRISGAGGDTMEDPGAELPKLKSEYDK